MTVIDRLVELAVRCCDPEQIYLFGSYAKGLQRVNSDIDLLVVLASAQRKQAIAGELRDLFAGVTLAVDVVITTPAALGAAPPASFLWSISRTARLVYQADRFAVESSCAAGNS